MSKKVVLIVSGVAALLVCGAGGALVYSGIGMGREYADTAITAAQFDAQKIGKSQKEVQDALPAPLELSEEAEAGYYGTDPTRQGMPNGASCVYHPVKPLTEVGDEPMYRFCFSAGELVEKKKIRTE
uniref:hypothetical protein n=1 Tax=Paractinoplanes polyasparticus TaxID=2856853 RepID=UPI001C8491D6|nr:hypothetical protein [Actinoplanes polyasparticus]